MKQIRPRKTCGIRIACLRFIKPLVSSRLKPFRALKKALNRLPDTIFIFPACSRIVLQSIRARGEKANKRAKLSCHSRWPFKPCSKLATGRQKR